VKFREESFEVLYSNQSVLEMNRPRIEELKERARQSPESKARICTHHSPRDPVQEMLIVHGKNCYVRPHKHLEKPEAFHVIEGKATLFLFEDNGDIKEAIKLGSYDSGGFFYYRLSEPLYHGLLIESEWFVFHEVTKGPFEPDETVYPDWAPTGESAASVQQFEDELRSKVSS